MNVTLEHIYLCVSHMPHMGPIRFQKLISHFGTAESAYKANRKQLCEIFNEKFVDEWVSFRTSFMSDSMLKMMYKNSIRHINFEAKEYPESLRTISDPPIGIFAKGDISIMNGDMPKVAIVGTRRPTSYGKQCTETIVSELAYAQTIIISGLALGIDGIAHCKALNYKMSTVAVLGSGIDIIYPKEHAQLYQEIAKKGLIISEHPPGHQTHKGSFPTRNRIISALSEKVIIIEGTKVSGTLITARYAAEQGKDVFALPGNITSYLSEAPNLLIQQGAQPIVSLKKVCDQLGIQTLGTKKTHNNLPADIIQLIKIIKFGATTPEKIGSKTDLPIEKILIKLSFLEIQGVISKNDEGEYYVLS